MPTYTERKVGTYRATYQGCTEKLMGDPEELRYIWRFQEKADATSAGEMAKITSTNIRNKQANAYKMMVGILGHDPRDGDDTEAHIGQEYDVLWGPNQAGNLTIVGVAPAYPGEDAAKTAKPKENAAKSEEGDGLPF